VIRTACGGGYGDAGQHEQSLWGWLAHIPGISVIVPSNPSDAGRLMITAIQENHPVVYLEHKLLAENWLDYMGKGGRKTVSFNVPEAGAYGEVPDSWEPIPMGTASIVQEGTDITFISLGVGVHRCKEAADVLKNEGITCEIIDLRFVKPLDKDLIIQSVKKTGNCVVVDEDYKEFGLSGEISAILSENGVKYNFGRVCTESTIPFSRNLEDEVIPNVKRILEETKRVLKK
jgi:pyruvate dehydrogenase E1 component beta subunit